MPGTVPDPWKFRKGMGMARRSSACSEEDRSVHTTTARRMCPKGNKNKCLLAVPFWLKEEGLGF